MNTRQAYTILYHNARCMRNLDERAKIVPLPTIALSAPLEARAQRIALVNAALKNHDERNESAMPLRCHKSISLNREILRQACKRFYGDPSRLPGKVGAR